MTDLFEPADKPVFPAKFWQDLAHADPLGMGVSAQDAEDWFEYTWIIMATYKPKLIERMVVNWWRYAREDEILKGRVRGQRIRDRKETQEMEQRAIARASPPPPPPSGIRLKIVNAS